MPHPHSKLTVYRTAMTAFKATHRMLATAGPGFTSDKDQLRRAMSSVVRNIAEGAGRWTPADKRARYIVARGEAAEAAACVEMLLAIGIVDEVTAREIDRDLDRVGAMLTRLIQRLTDP